MLASGLSQIKVNLLQPDAAHITAGRHAFGRQPFPARDASRMKPPRGREYSFILLVVQVVRARHHVPMQREAGVLETKLYEKCP